MEGLPELGPGGDLLFLPAAIPTPVRLLIGHRECFACAGTNIMEDAKRRRPPRQLLGGGHAGHAAYILPAQGWIDVTVCVRGASATAMRVRARGQTTHTGHDA